MADLDSLTIKISADASEAIKNVNALADALNGLKGSLKNIGGGGIAKAAGDISNATQKVASSSKNAAKGLSEISSAKASVAQVSGEVKNLANTSNDAAKATKEMGDSVGNSGTNNFSRFSGILKSVSTSLRETSQKAISAVKSIKLFHKSSRSSSISAGKLAKELLRVAKMFKLMITRMVLRKIITGVGDGFKNLAQYSSQVNASISLLWNGFRQLGNSIAAAASPLLNAFAPAIMRIIDLCIEAVNAINRLISALLGFSTWTRAKKLTDSYADSLKSASGAAKELKKTVLGFDELNQLQENKNSGSGGTSPSDMFETLDLDLQIDNLGKYLGEKLREMLESIPWSNIRSTANRLGREVANLINSFIEVERLAYDIGNTIAQSINTVFEFFNGFVHELHWDSVGRFIADAFNGLFENIDWALIRDTVVTGMTGIAESINTFIQTFHWDNISETIGNFINTAVAGAYAFISNTDWSTLGAKMGEQLTATIGKIDWLAVGRAIGSIIHSAIGYVSSFIKNLDWQTIIKALKDLICGFFEDIDAEDVGIIIGGVLATSFVKGFAELRTGTAVEECGSSLLGFLGDVLSYVAGGFAVGSIIKDVAFLASEKAAKVVWEDEETAANVHAVGQEYKGLLGTITMLKDVFSGEWKNKTYEVFNETTGELERVINASGETVISIQESTSEVKKRLREQSVSFEQELNKQKSSITNATMTVKNESTGMSKTIETTTVNMKKNFSSATISMQGDMKTLEKSSDTLKGSFSKDKWTFSGVAEGLSQTFSDAVNAVKGVWNGFADKLNGSFTVAGKTFNINLPKLYANGGFPSQGSMFIAGESGAELVGNINGRTAVANNDQITNGIAQAVYSAMMSANSGGSARYINNTIQIDGKTIARAVTVGQNDLNRRYSPTMA